jgi:hypothetical protein
MKYLKFTGLLVLLLVTAWLTASLPASESAWAHGVQFPERQTVPFTRTPTPVRSPTDTPVPPTATGESRPSATPTFPAPATSTATGAGPQPPTPTSSTPPVTSTPTGTPSASAPPQLTSIPTGTPSAIANQTLVQAASGTPSNPPQATNTRGATPDSTIIVTTRPADIASPTPKSFEARPTEAATSPILPDVTPQPSVPVQTRDGISFVALSLLAGSLLIGLGLVLKWLKK